WSSHACTGSWLRAPIRAFQRPRRARITARLGRLQWVFSLAVRQAGPPSIPEEHPDRRRAFRPRLAPSRVGHGRWARRLSHRSLHAIRGCFSLPMMRPCDLIAHDPMTAVGMAGLGAELDDDGRHSGFSITQYQAEYRGLVQYY